MFSGRPRASRQGDNRMGRPYKKGEGRVNQVAREPVLTLLIRSTNSTIKGYRSSHSSARVGSHTNETLQTDALTPHDLRYKIHYRVTISLILAKWLNAKVSGVAQVGLSGSWHLGDDPCVRRRRIACLQLHMKNLQPLPSSYPQPGIIAIVFIELRLLWSPYRATERLPG